MAAEISQSIIDTATRLFLDDGFEGTSMDAVAVAAGIPRSTLYKRYSDKRELLKDVIAHRMENWGQISQRTSRIPDEGLTERIQHYCAVMIRWSTHPEISAFHRLSMHAWPAPEEESVRQKIRGISHMEGLIAKDIRNYGNVGTRMYDDPEKAAALLMALMLGWTELRTDKSPMTQENALKAAHDIVDLFLHGIG